MRLLFACSIALGLLASCTSFSANDTDVPNPDGGAGTDASPMPREVGPANTISKHQAGVRGIAVDESTIWFTNEQTNEVRSLPKTGGDSTKLLDAFGATDIAVDATRVYWIDRSPVDISQSTLYKSTDKTGQNHIDGPAYLQSSRLARVGAHSFTAALTSSATFLVARDNEAIEDLGFNFAPKCITWNGVTTFYEHAKMILASPPIGANDGGVSNVFAQAEANDIVADDNEVFWITTTGSVQKLAKDAAGAAPIDLATGVGGLTRMALDSTYVYVTASGIGPTTGRVLRIPKAGGASVEIATGLAEPWGIVADASGVYVANHGDGTIIAIPFR